MNEAKNPNIHECTLLSSASVFVGDFWHFLGYLADEVSAYGSIRSVEKNPARLFMIQSTRQQSFWLSASTMYTEARKQGVIVRNWSALQQCTIGSEGLRSFTRRFWTFWQGRSQESRDGNGSVGQWPIDPWWWNNCAVACNFKYTTYRLTV